MKSEENENKEYSKKIIISLILVIILVLLVICLSFSAYIKMEQNKQSKDDVKANVSMTYTESTNGISIENAAPTSDEVGKKLNGKNEYFDFTVSTKNPKKTKVVYEIAAVKDKNSTISDNDIRIYLEKQVSGTYEEIVNPTPFKAIIKDSEIGSPKGSMILKKVKTKVSSNDNYRLRMWLSDKANIQDVKTYAVKINVYGKLSKGR